MNRSFFFILSAATLFLLISEWLQKIGLIPNIFGIRHFTLLLSFLLLFFASKNTIWTKLDKSYTIKAFILSIILIVALIAVQPRILNYLIGISFTFLFAIIMFLGSKLRIHITSIIHYLKVTTYILLFLGLPPFLNALIQFESMRWHPGIFRELGALGGLMNIGVIFSLYLFLQTKRKQFLRISYVFSLIVIATILKKSIIDLIIIWITFFYFFQKFKIFKTKRIVYSILIVFIILTPVIYDELAENLNMNANYLNTAGVDGHVRLAMYLAAFKIGVDYFPFGSGFGTFGTPASVFGGYSNLYHEYNISSIETLSEYRVMNNFSHTLFDTYWPHIIAEIGFIGFFIFLSLWFFPIRRSLKIYRKRKGYIDRCNLYLILTLILTISLDGLTLFNPEIPLFILFSHGITSIINNAQFSE